MRQFKADLLARENAQMMRMAQQWLELELGMRASFSDLAQDVYTRREAGERIDRATLYRMERYGRLLRQMQAIIVGQYAPYVADEVTTQQRRLLRSGIDDAAAAIQAVQAAVSYTHLRAHETVLELVSRLLLQKTKHTTPH